MIFNFAKFKVIYFLQKAAFFNLEIILLLLTIANRINRPKIIKFIAKKTLMHWLKVYFDSRLFFSDYTEKMANKKHKAISGLLMLVKTTRKVEILIMQKAVHAYILPIFT